jgi:glycosyltransferase involved in cell wall biosynthesis
MRIGMLAPAWRIPPVGYGGLEVAVDALCRGLAEMGHEVDLWSARDSACPVSCAGILKSDEADRSRWVSGDVSHLLAGYDWLINRKVDVIHDHTMWGPLLIASLCEVPVLTTSHLPFSDKLIAFPYIRVAERGVPVIALSRAHASEAPPGVVAAVIPHGLDISEVPIGGGRGGYAAFLGRLSEDKGVEFAIDACERAGIPLRIAAPLVESSERQYFAERVAPRLSDMVEYVGEMSLVEKYSFLGEAVALVNPISWSEPFGLVMIEALAAGCPVIAFERGSASEIVSHGQSGWLCRSVDEMAARLRDIDQISRRDCRLRAHVRFNHRLMAKRHLAVYEQSRL